MKKRAVIKENLLNIIFICLIFTILITASVSAGWFDWLKKITGEVTQVQLNITIGAGTAPVILQVYNDTVGSITLTAGPSATIINVNFSVYDADTASNLDDTKAAVNLTKSGEAVRRNTTCVELNSAGNYANYTCMVKLYWYDVDGNWIINTSIKDLNANEATNSSNIFVINPLTGFELSPATIPWGAVSPGATNQTPTSQTPVLLNNTGNQDIASGSVKVNATSLMGETTNTEGLYSGNFTISNSTTVGKVECDLSNKTAIQMSLVSGANFMAINNTQEVNAILPAGDYTLSDGTAQEQLYFCLTKAGTEISSQAYSTYLTGSWTISIT